MMSEFKTRSGNLADDLAVDLAGIGTWRRG